LGPVAACATGDEEATNPMAMPALFQDRLKLPVMAARCS
jgi:hypothetical protein